jgi:hypothetical protein
VEVRVLSATSKKATESDSVAFLFFQIRRILMRGLLILFAIGGAAATVFFGYFTFVDFVLLRQSYAAFERLTPQTSLSAILLAEARQNVYCINVFADGTWALLSALISVVGIHGLVGTANPTSQSDAEL